MDFFIKASIASACLLISLAYVHGQCGSSTTFSTTPLTTSVKYIASDNYPSYYYNYITCQTTITNTGGGRILFHVDFQDIERGYDFLNIYTGSISSSNLLHNSETGYAGVVRFANAGDNLIVRFTTDSSITYGGYKLEFIEVDSLESCGNSITANSTEQQLSYVYSWHDQSPCVWTLNAVDAVEIRVIFLNGLVWIREAGTDTYLNTVGSTYVSGHASSIQVIGYSSNDFVLMYKSSNTGATGASIPATAQTQTSGISSICYEGHKTAVSVPSHLNSPNYPSSYPNNIDCTVTITSYNPEAAVYLNIIDYSVQYSDYLSIYDGPSVFFDEIYDQLTTGNEIVSSGESITLRFRTNDYGQDRGFNISYRNISRDVPPCSIAPHVSVTADDTETTLFSPNYPNNYNNDVDYYLLITKPSVSNHIVIDFRDFHLETNYDCTYDYVAIYDGACTDDRLISKICGDDAVTYEEETGIYILIHFHTDSSVTDIGWALRYYIGDFQDPDADESTDESSSGIPDFVYPVIAIVVIIIGTIIVATFIFIQSNKRRVGVGEGKPEIKRRTVTNLMKEIKVNVLAPPQKHTKTTSKHRTPVPPPPQNLPPLIHDPVYPPVDYQFTGSQMPTQNIVPAIPQGGSLQPSAPILPSTSGSSMIPPPYSYMSPSDARNAGIYG